MTFSAAGSPSPLTAQGQLNFGRDVLRAEAQVLLDLSEQLGASFCQAVSLLFECRGSTIVTGMGKAGLVGQKIAATLASTCTRSHFLHPGEAVHGDLGRVHADDVVIVLSNSGETEEITRLLGPLRQMGVELIAITSNANSTLAGDATVTLDLGEFKEADPLGLAPTSSTTAMMAIGDALALVVARVRGVKAEDFYRFHPSGSLGRKLSRVEEFMQPLERCRVAPDDLTVKGVFVRVSRPGRRTGAIMLTDHDGKLSGIFTDSDLARLFEQANENVFDQLIRNIMTRSPTTITTGSRFQKAVDLLAGKKISELPVVDNDGRPVGLVDITDVVGLLPDQSAADGDDVTFPLRVVDGPDSCDPTLASKQAG